MRRRDSGINIETKVETVKDRLGNLSNDTFVARAERRYMVGADTPGFHSLKRQGKLIPHTPFTQVEWVGRHVQGELTVRRNSDGKSVIYTNAQGGSRPVSWRIEDFVDYDADPTGNPPASDMEYANYHLQRAAANISARGWDALTFLAESKKTARMINGFGRRLLKLIGSRDPRDALKLWLEMRYGWRTLLFDVRDIYDAAYNWDAKRKLFTERSGFSVDHHSPSELVAKQTLTETVNRIYRESTSTFSIRGAVAGLFSPARLRFNPVNTAWELVPFSFVLDWIYDVGTALEAAAFITGSSQHTASIGFQCDSIVSFHSTYEAKSGFTVTADGIDYVYEGRRQSRSPTKISLTPQFTGRNITPELALDMRAISYVRSRL